MNIPEIKIKLSFKKKVAPDKLFHIVSIIDAYEAFKQVFNADTFNWTEEMIMLCLNQANKVVGFYKVSSGGRTSTIIDNRIIFSVAINCAATKIIIAHNHPSGNLKPSAADLKVTEKLKQACEIMEISLIDHLIVSEEGFYSFATEGLLGGEYKPKS